MEIKRIPWNKGLKGVQKSHREGISLIEEYGEEKAIKIRKMISETLKGKNNYWYGRHHSEETKLKMSIAQMGEKNHRYGKSRTDEEKKKISEFNKGYKHSEEAKIKISKSNIGRRRSEETKRKISATKQGITIKEWRGYIVDNPYNYNFNLRFKEKIKERDNHSCILCNLLEKDCKVLYKQGLSVHHIDYDKKNTFPQNCCSLCLKCNNLVNNNRQHWKTFFQSLLKERYSYEYTIEHNIILDFRGESNA